MPTEPHCLPVCTPSNTPDSTTTHRALSSRIRMTPHYTWVWFRCPLSVISNQQTCSSSFSIQDWVHSTTMEKRTSRDIAEPCLPIWRLTRKHRGMDSCSSIPGLRGPEASGIGTVSCATPSPHWLPRGGAIRGSHGLPCSPRSSTRTHSLSLPQFPPAEAGHFEPAVGEASPGVLS